MGEDGFTTHVFKPTPKIEVLDLPMIIGQFHKKTLITPKGLEINIYAASAKGLEPTEFAQQVTQKCVEFYEQKLGIKNTHGKLDMITLFGIQCEEMYNWGIMPCRKQNIFVNHTSEYFL